MKKNSLWIAIFLLFALCIAQNSFAESWIFNNTNLKVENLAVTSEGVEFKIKTRLRLIVALNSSCTNEFIIPRGQLDYDMLAAFLLTAYAKKKKVGIVFDNDSVECMVPVNSVVLY
jgi:hypothetical protein